MKKLKIAEMSLVVGLCCVYMSETPHAPASDVICLGRGNMYDNPDSPRNCTLSSSQQSLVGAKSNPLEDLLADALKAIERKEKKIVQFQDHPEVIEFSEHEIKKFSEREIKNYNLIIEEMKDTAKVVNKLLEGTGITVTNAVEVKGNYKCYVYDLDTIAEDTETITDGNYNYKVITQDSARITFYTSEALEFWSDSDPYSDIDDPVGASFAKLIIYAQYISNKDEVVSMIAQGPEREADDVDTAADVRFLSAARECEADLVFTARPRINSQVVIEKETEICTAKSIPAKPEIIETLVEVINIGGRSKEAADKPEDPFAAARYKLSQEEKNAPSF